MFITFCRYIPFFFLSWFLEVQFWYQNHQTLPLKLLLAGQCQKRTTVKQVQNNFRSPTWLEYFLCAGITEYWTCSSVISDTMCFTDKLGKNSCWVISMMSIPSDTHLTALITFVALEKYILKDKGVDKEYNMMKTPSNKWAILSITPLNFLGIFHFHPCNIYINSASQHSWCQYTWKALRGDKAVHKYFPCYHHHGIFSLNCLKTEAQVHRVAKNTLKTSGCLAHTSSPFSEARYRKTDNGPQIAWSIYSFWGTPGTTKVCNSMSYMQDSTICSCLLKLADSFQADSSINVIA